MKLTTESRGQEADVGGLILGDFHQVRIEWIREPSIDEHLLRVVLETLTVEGSLKVLEGKSIVEDVGCEEMLVCPAQNKILMKTYHQ